MWKVKINQLVLFSTLIGLFGLLLLGCSSNDNNNTPPADVGQTRNVVQVQEVVGDVLNFFQNRRGLDVNQFCFLLVQLQPSGKTEVNGANVPCPSPLADVDPSSIVIRLTVGPANTLFDNLRTVPWSNSAIGKLVNNTIPDLCTGSYASLCSIAVNGSAPLQITGINGP